jgi:hypothetical protein
LRAGREELGGIGQAGEKRGHLHTIRRNTFWADSMRVSLDNGKLDFKLSTSLERDTYIY